MTRKPKVTAGLKCPPETWPTAANMTPIASPCASAMPTSPDWAETMIEGADADEDQREGAHELGGEPPDGVVLHPRRTGYERGLDGIPRFRDRAGLPIPRAVVVDGGQRHRIPNRRALRRAWAKQRGFVTVPRLVALVPGEAAAMRRAQAPTRGRGD